MGLVGLAAIYFWQGSHTLSYLSRIFSVSNIQMQVLYALLVVLFFQVYLFLMIKSGRAQMPTTPDSLFLIQMARASRWNIVMIGILPGVLEEILFRGALMGMLSSWFGMPAGLLLSSIFFGISHIKQYQGSLPILVYIFMLGFAIGGLFGITGNLWGPIIAHSLNNILNTLWIRSGRIQMKKKDQSFQI
jgi:membrane protease YdiL (CAAX protease family)